MKFCFIRLNLGHLLHPYEHVIIQLPVENGNNVDLKTNVQSWSDSFDPVVHYVKVTHWPNDNVFHAPFGSRMYQKYQITFHRKLLAFYAANSDKTINLNLFLHHEPNGSTKGKLSNRNQETNICLYLYTGSCLVECIAVYSSFVLYVTFLLFFLFFNVTLRS